MPEFQYTARDERGEKIRGTLDAATQAEALAALAARGLFPVAMEKAKIAGGAGRVGRVSGQRMAAFYAQLSDLLRGGVPLLRALRIQREQTSHAGLKHVLDEVYRRVEEGDTFAEAMGRYPKVFGEMAINMIRAGIEGGFLEQSLNHVADYTEAQDDLKKRITGALAYPVILTVFMMVVVLVILAYFVPKFDPFFDDLRQRGELPMITEGLLATGNATKLAVPLAIPLLALGFWGFRQWGKSDHGRRRIDRAKLKLPLIGRIYEGFAVARFCRVLGTLLRNGVPILRSLEISRDAIGNRVLADAIHRATENITSGERLADPLAESDCFPRPVVEMIAVAEEANTLDTVLVDIADSLEKRNWRQLDLAVRFLEPCMLMLLGGVVLVLVLSLMLPVFKMSQLA
jgi:general secretion pathway protein F/type IV pilus assembly protein PilC